MANVKISELPSGTVPLSGTEEVPILQGGNTVQTTVQDIANLAAPPTPSLQEVTNVGSTTLNSIRVGQRLEISNTSGHLGYLQDTNITDIRTLEFPDNSGTIALLSDIPSGIGYKSYVVNFNWDGFTWSATTIYENSLGSSVSLSLGAAGRLRLTTSGLFTLGKTVVMPCIIAWGQSTLIGTLDTSTFTPTINDIYIKWSNSSGSIATPATFAVGAYILEVRVYN